MDDYFYNLMPVLYLGIVLCFGQGWLERGTFYGCYLCYKWACSYCLIHGLYNCNMALIFQAIFFKRFI